MSKEREKQYVDGDNTFEDWLLNETGMAVWPIGAFEQHGHHLPLNSDNIQAEYYAKHIANHFKACLLPLQPFGTSLEHQGFRGTITLTPKLLMDLVENMADELEKQNFTRLIVVNGHGGNFSLSPVVRKINRADRGIKLLLVYPWEFGGDIKDIPEIHAGLFETSMMLALRKDLVGKRRVDKDPFKDSPPYSQFDLNHFGVGRMNPDGTWGYPSKASLSTGKKFLEKMKKRVIPWIEERLKKWDDDPRYGGPGPVALRKLSARDIPLGMRLKNNVGWNQLKEDWKLLLKQSGDGSYVAIHNGKKVGTVTTVTYEKRFSWIGMVLVDPEIRRCGIGTKLLDAAIAAGEKVAPVRLDATPMGKKLYDTLGFKDEYHLERLEIDKLPAIKDKVETPIKPMSKSDLKAILSYDKNIFGADRKYVLEHLHSSSKECAWVARKGKNILGFSLGRPGSKFHQVGPIIAENDKVAKDLAIKALQKLKGKAVITDILTQQRGFRSWLFDMGFEVQRPFIRMCRGKLKFPGKPGKQFSIAAPELG